METVRGQIRRRFSQSVLEQLTRYLVFKAVFPEQRRLEFLFGISRLYQKSHLQGVMRRTGLIRLLPQRVKLLDEYLPSVPSKFFKVTDHVTTPPQGEKEHRVGFFSGCVMSLVYPSANEATLRVLTRNGCEVIAPLRQKCCGALHVHNGELHVAKQLARANIDAFEKTGVEFIISNAGGCGTTLREYAELLADDIQYASRAEEFSKKVRDLSEFLLAINLNKSFGRIEAKATYQDSCHAAHAGKITEQPRTLIKSIPGIEFIEMKDADRCCASGGSYWFTKHDLSMKLLDSKMTNIVATRADLIVSANPPCLMQLQFGVRRTGMNAEVVHLAELLDRAYQASKS
jgi:glycolate oxidase iron-sulfur subunit